jgi:hypothetical protein
MKVVVGFDSAWCLQAVVWCEFDPSPRDATSSPLFEGDGFLVPTSHTTLQRQTEKAFLAPHKRSNYTSWPSSAPASSSSSSSSISSLLNAASRQNVDTRSRHVEHARPPTLQTADTAHARLLHLNTDMILEQQHIYQEQRHRIITWLQHDDDEDDPSSSGGGVNAWDIALLFLFLFFGLNAALNLQQESRMFLVATSSSWLDWTPRRPNHELQRQKDPSSYDDETECPCCCEPYDVSPSWNKYHDKTAAVRLPILSQACIHSYCLQCARQDRQRIVELSLMSATPSAEQSCLLFYFLTSGSPSTSYATAIRCPFCRQLGAFDVQTPILRPDAYDAYMNAEQKSSHGIKSNNNAMHPNKVRCKLKG